MPLTCRSPVRSAVSSSSSRACAALSSGSPPNGDGVPDRIAAVSSTVSALTSIRSRMVGIRSASAARASSTV
jgi:hypothetical protein